MSVLLSEAVTLFRVKYYRNGSHAGFILYPHKTKATLIKSVTQ